MALKAIIYGFIGLTFAALCIHRTGDQAWPMLVWLAAFYVSGFIREVYGKLSQDNEIIISQATLFDRCLIGGVFITWSLLPNLQTASGWLDFANYDLPTNLLIAGAALQLPALYLFWRSHADLGRNWNMSMEIHSEQKLVDYGIYRRIRHPMYSAIFLSTFGQALLMQNWLAGFSAIPAFAALYFTRVPQEEAMMVKRFGDEYQDYKKRTGRLVPRFR